MEINADTSARKPEEEGPETRDGGGGLRRAVLELIALITIAWFVSVLIEPDPPGLNIVRFGLKWFVYTYLMAATVYVLIPFCFLFSVGAAISRLASRNPTYWAAYRFAFIVATAWTALGNYGIWYAS